MTCELSSRVISSYVVSRCVVFYNFLPFHFILFHFILSCVFLFHVLSFHFVSCHMILLLTIMSCNLLSCHAMSSSHDSVLEVNMFWYIQNTQYDKLYSPYHNFCHSAGILLSSPAEAQQWEDNTQGDTTEQRGRRWEPETAKQSQGKGGEQSETSVKVKGWGQTWDDPRSWSSHYVPSQRSSQWNSRWMNHMFTCSHVHIHASCADWWISFSNQHGPCCFVISVKHTFQQILPIACITLVHLSKNIMPSSNSGLQMLF